MCFRRKADNDLFFFGQRGGVRGRQKEEREEDVLAKICRTRIYPAFGSGPGGLGGEDWVKAVLLVVLMVLGLDKYNMSAAE